MTPKEILVEARKLVADPKTFTQRMAARDKHGFACQPRSPRAICWCSAGALSKVSDRGPQLTAARALVDQAARDLYSCSRIEQVNDDPHGRERALDCFDRAIAASA